MRRALVWLNLYGRQAARHKLKSGLKTQKMNFLPVFELTLASLTAIWVEQNQCLLHLSILLTQGPIYEILRIGDFEKSVILNFFFLEKKNWKWRTQKNVGQPQDHIDWTTSMPFSSINPTNPRTNLWNFGRNCSAFGGGFLSRPFWIFFSNFFQIFFCFILIWIYHKLMGTKDFLKLWETLLNEIWLTYSHHSIIRTVR